MRRNRNCKAGEDIIKHVGIALSEINNIVNMLRNGQIKGRAVIVPK
jgi:hypothetical protein